MSCIIPEAGDNGKVDKAFAASAIHYFMLFLCWYDLPVSRKRLKATNPFLVLT